jgi:hypothetical protein
MGQKTTYKMKGKTGEVCQQSGDYKCSKHAQIIPLTKGERFPPCNSGGSHGAYWHLIKKR